VHTLDAERSRGVADGTRVGGFFFFLRPEA
jgi:hypothetical protein